jgi:hypothetical protein
MSTARLRLAFIVTVFALLTARIADGGEPPANMQEHFAQCRAAKNTSEALVCYEAFWRKYCPEEDGGLPAAGKGYGDGSHVIHVRACAYRLLELYITAKNEEKTKKFLRWLEEKDPVIGSMPARLQQHAPK